MQLVGLVVGPSAVRFSVKLAPGGIVACAFRGSMTTVTPSMWKRASQTALMTSLGNCTRSSQPWTGLVPLLVIVNCPWKASPFNCPLFNCSTWSPCPTSVKVTVTPEVDVGVGVGDGDFVGVGVWCGEVGLGVGDVLVGVADGEGELGVGPACAALPVGAGRL